MAISPNDVENPNSWIDLVHNGKIVQCPYCKINASIRQQDGRTWVAYYKGIMGFVSHVIAAHETEFQADEAKNPKYRGKPGKTERIKDGLTDMTREQMEAYRRKGEGHTSMPLSNIFSTSTLEAILILSNPVPPVVAINPRYRTWLNLKNQQNEPRPSYPPPDDPDTIICIPPRDKRPREDHPSYGPTGSGSRMPGTFTAVNERSVRNRYVSAPHIHTHTLAMLEPKLKMLSRSNNIPAPVASRSVGGERRYVDLSDDHGEEQDRKRVFTEMDRNIRGSIFPADDLYRDSIIPQSPVDEAPSWRY
jgi:hypothetical protein